MQLRCRDHSESGILKIYRLAISQFVTPHIKRTKAAINAAFVLLRFHKKIYSETRVDVSRKQGIQVDATIRQWRPYTTLDRTQ
jgi:hypothetical protein